MFRIRRIYDDTLPNDKKIIAEIQNILRSQFSLLAEKEIEELPRQLNNPFKYHLRAILFVAEDLKGHVNGFAFIFHVPSLNFVFLDFMSAAKYRTGKGIGSALYQRVREEAILLNSVGIFFECLPDERKLCKDPKTLQQNKTRLRFYEKYGARPIINTKYETPIKPGKDNPPYLVYDDLGRNYPLPKNTARTIVRTILERKYKKLCPKEYIDMVVNSFNDNPVQLRPRKYFKTEQLPQLQITVPFYDRIVLVVADKHEIHHIKEKGYVEAPVRIDSILKNLENSDLFRRVIPKNHSIKHIAAVHDIKFLTYLRKMCALIPPEKSLYPYVFPIRHPERAPKEMPIRAGYYCIDTFTPLTHNVFIAAKRAVDCALTAAQMLLLGNRIAYALIRPPGHHAEKKVFGGFCYLNSSAIVANFLSTYGKIAILDIDYHHGNGQQDIFWHRNDVLTVSIHGHPHIAFPFFSGYKDEIGGGDGKGFNVNISLPENITCETYHLYLQKALNIIKKFNPKFLVVSFGLDTAKEDPTGTWNLTEENFARNGAMIAGLCKPTLIVQEGGYNTRSLGKNVECFFSALWAGIHKFSALFEKSLGLSII